MGQPSTLTPLTENSGQTSGRLDETAERHETEGKRKWQSLSEGASTTLRPSKPLVSGTEGGHTTDKLRCGIMVSFMSNVYSLRYLRISCLASKFELEIIC